MNWDYHELKGKWITLHSKKRTYQFKCADVLLLNEYNLKFFGSGAVPDPIFTQYSEIDIMGNMLPVSVKAINSVTGSNCTIEAEVILSGPDFWPQNDIQP